MIFGWLLGAWIAFTYFYLVREHVHTHVTDLMNGRAKTSAKVYYCISTIAWLLLVVVLLVTYLIVKNKPIKDLIETSNCD